MRPGITSFVLAGALLGGAVDVDAQAPSAPAPSPGHAQLEEARRHFYNARYDVAAAQTLAACADGPESLPACELRTAALLFQIKRALGAATDREAAWKQCVVCPDLMTAFQAAFVRGQSEGRAALAANPHDEATMFLLSKIDLHFVWLQLGTLGRKTGWGEYWEARKTLDKLLKRNPTHVRALVARAWIDYIVDTRMPRGTRWVLGGGNKKRALKVVRDAADTAGDFFVRAEARFALWDMQVRERQMREAMVTARALAVDFPENEELIRFIGSHQRSVPE